MRFSDCQVVHRDLASRNVLLAEGMICKVSDFGMSRDVYVDQSYTKLGHGKGRISTIGRSKYNCSLKILTLCPEMGEGEGDGEGWSVRSNICCVTLLWCVSPSQVVGPGVSEGPALHQQVGCLELGRPALGNILSWGHSLPRHRVRR